MSKATEQLHYEFCDVLDQVEKIMAGHKCGHWKLSLIARNPEPGHDGEWVNCTNDDPAEVAKVIVQSDASVRGPDVAP